ncbi:MAG TPA: hypothetical protein VMW70_09985 [Burkholderiales bacterium]|nr:hypothetical protein [Burkholderiales bacterium]
MSAASKSSFAAPGFYRIEVQGRLHNNWSTRFGAMQLSSYVPDGNVEVTVLQGAIRDQPELAGIIKTLHELHLTLRSVRYLGKVPPTA